MDHSSNQHTYGVCPVCLISQENLSQHLSSHSKDEIINVLTPQNPISENNTQSYSSDNPVIFQSEEPPKRSTDYTSQEHAAINPVENGATILGTNIFSTPSILPYQNSLSTPPPLLTGMKNNSIGVNSNMMPASFPTVRATYIQNGSTTGIPQFTPPSIPIMYRPPNATFQIPNIGGNTPVLFQTPHVNLNAYNGFASPTINGSYSVGSPSVDQTGSTLPDIALPSSTSHIVPTPSSAPLDSTASQVKVISDGSSVQANSFPSCTLPSADNPGQQTFLCILPLSQVQPSVPAGGNYILYGNNVLPPSNVMPEVLQATTNNSQFPNTIYYMPSNLSQFGFRQEVSPAQNNQSNLKPEVTESRVQTSLTKISSSSSSSQTVIKIDKSSNCVIEEKMSSQNPQPIENKATINVGDKIKITIPKDIVGKKERLKELINQELVRALLINDSAEGESSSSNSSSINKQKEDSLLDNKIKDVQNNQNISQETKEITFNDHEIDSHSLSSLPISLSSPKVQCSRSNSSQNENSSASTSKIVYKNVEIKNELKASTVPILLKEKKDSGKHEARLESPNQSHNFDLSLKTKSHLKTVSQQNKHLLNSSGNVPSVKFKSEGTVDEMDTDTSLALLSLEKNFNFLGDAVFSDSSYPEDQVLGAVEEVFDTESSVNDCKSELNSGKLSTLNFATHSNLGFENQISSQLSLIENALSSSPKHNNSGLSSKISPMKYAKTYNRAKKSNNFTINSGCKDSATESLGTSLQIDAKLQCISMSTDEEMVDDPTEEMETHSNAASETFSKDLFGEEAFSDDSKEIRNSLYQGVPLKVENGDTNGTHTEEIMSLKASETLADSDSERATPNEEMTEVLLYSCKISKFK